MAETIDTVVLSGSGYAGAEALRLLASHPHFQVVAATGHATAGTPIGKLHPHLAVDYPTMELVKVEALAPMLQGTGPLAILGCGPHGSSAADTAAILGLAEELGRPAKAVDLSADFRHDAALFEALYGVTHPAPELLADFHCGLPDLDAEITPAHACQPGCFTTSVVLACAPLVAAGVTGSTIRVSSVTGSTGSGRNPKPGTHHPRRHGNLWGYKALDHRHAPEMAGLIGRASGAEVDVRFVPHSGPFARGIASTCFLEAASKTDAATLRGILTDAYAHTPFVTVEPGPPELASVVGTNRCHLSVTTDGHEIVVHSVIDNLLKGAAGGAVQWLNRLHGLPDATGLMAGPIPWS